MSVYTSIDYISKQNHKTFKYYRNLLKPAEKTNYDTILAGFFAYSKSIPIVGIDAKQAQNVYEAIKLDNPATFFVETVSLKYIHGTNVGFAEPKYRFAIEEANSTLEALLDKSKIILGQIDRAQVDLEFAVNDFICKNVHYDMSMKASSFECVGPLLFGRGVCEGISKAVKFLFDLASIKSIVVYGETANCPGPGGAKDQPHAWNVINLDNDFYHLDVTFNLSVQAFGVLRYDYFNISDMEILLDHRISSVSLPMCPQSMDYYKTHNLYFNSQSEYRQYLLYCLKHGKKDIVFKLPNVGNIERVKSRVIEISNEALASLHMEGNMYQLVCNETQSVFQLHAI